VLPALIALTLVLMSSTLLAQTPGPAAAEICLTCHGPAGDAISAAPGAPAVPRLEGQHAEYLVKQLRDFKAGKRKNDLMMPVLATLRGRQFSELAAHFSSLSTERRPSVEASSADKGRVLYEEGNTATGVPACVGCHRANGVGAPRYPRLAGQRPAYVVQQLTNFKQGARTNDRAHVMRSIAEKLTDDEMAAIATYLAGQ
jgi:cytochrome c553